MLHGSESNGSISRFCDGIGTVKIVDPLKGVKTHALVACVGVGEAWLHFTARSSTPTADMRSQPSVYCKLCRSLSRFLSASGRSSFALSGWRPSLASASVTRWGSGMLPEASASARKRRQPVDTSPRNLPTAVSEFSSFAALHDVPRTGGLSKIKALIIGSIANLTDGTCDPGRMR